MATQGDARTLDDVVGEVTAAWDAGPRGDPGEPETEWMVAVDLEGLPDLAPLRDPQELETMADDLRRG